MKRLLVLLAIMAIIFVPAMAMAYNPGEELPPSAVEVEHWELERVPGSNPAEYQWVPKGTGNTASLARCWRSIPANGNCNKEIWTFDFIHHASVAQWCEWSMGGTRWDWRILKPGSFAADCIEATLKSNNDVSVTLSGFADLKYKESAPAGTEDTIKTYYSYGETIDDAVANGWAPASQINQTRLIPNSAALHEGYSVKLWNMIEVVACNNSCEYEDTGTITIALQNIKLWVDPATGSWK